MKRKLKKLSRSWRFKACAVFGATVISDFIWAKYMAAVAGNLALVAAGWSVFIIAIGAFLTVSYVDDKRLIIPACIGAFVGTYLAI